MPGHSVRVAVEGCGHGTLHAIYASIQKSCEVKGWDGVDLVIIGGDFQAVRNAYDLNGMSVPVKYREIGDFHEYYSGAREAPYLTIFVGGNHEASNHMFELYYGGWVAPKIYYMGAANVVSYGPLRIAGLSGIWKGYNYKKTHHERLPYNQDDVKSIYHVREWDVRKLLQIRTQVDIGISHDWPRGVEWMGDWKALFSQKSHFESDARDGSLGSVAARKVLDRLRPSYWFSAHLHCKFSAIVKHHNEGEPSVLVNTKEDLVATRATQNDQEINLGIDDLGETNNDGVDVTNRNEDEIELDMDGEEEKSEQQSSPIARKGVTKPHDPSLVPQSLLDQLPDSFRQGSKSKPALQLPFPEQIKNQTTQFLALDKCLPNRKFLQLLEIEQGCSSEKTVTERPFKLGYDKEWLAITRVFAASFVVGDPIARPPHDKGEVFYQDLIMAEKAWIDRELVSQNRMEIPENFEITAPVYRPDVSISNPEHPTEYSNPQTAFFCDLLGIPNPFHISEAERQARAEKGPALDPARIDRGRGGHRGFGRGSERGGRGGGRGGRRRAGNDGGRRF